MKTDRIAILLATYNGEHYIREQIDSLYTQTYREWTIFVHDDGSTDKTCQILNEYAQKNDNLKVLSYPSQKGASNNFFSLLKRVNADYYFFSDQDDKWLPKKIEHSMKRMKAEEGRNIGKPVLVCCDVFVVDSELDLLSESLWKQAGTHPEFLTKFNECAATPFVTGCTMLINRKAKETVLWDKVKYATMHDAFITMCVLKANGIVSPIFESLMLYRQHGNNTLGAYSAQNNCLWHKIINIKNIIKQNLLWLRMLKAIEYGSIFKFFKYKFEYKRKVRLS